MANKPGDSILAAIQEQSDIAKDIVAWFDEIYGIYVQGEINNHLYQMISFERCPDEYLDYFMYEKGFSTHKSMTPNSKRDVLRNWKFIHENRLSQRGLEMYLKSIFQVDLVTSGWQHVSWKKRFIQTQNSIYGFPNAESLSSAFQEGDTMTYLYSPDFVESDRLDIQLSAHNAYTDSLLDYAFEICRYELAKTCSYKNLLINIVDEHYNIMKTQTI